MSPAQPIRSLAAIVFTDIVGYSAMVNRDDANAMQLVREHFALVREIAARFGGKVIKTIGDSVHLEFASAQAATACAISVQQAHRQRNARVAPEQQFEIRIGLHLGDVEHRDGDIYGDGVNIAARLQPLAPVGGIAISDDVRNQLRLDLRNRFTSRGTPTLKNIDTPIELFVLEGDALAAIAVEPGASTPSAIRRPLLLRAVLAVMAIAVVLVIGLSVLRTHGPTSSAPAVTDKSIAVLPFANLSSDKEQEYFSDGVAEDVLNLLSKVPQLRVIARTSSFSFKGKDVPIGEIARVLQVTSILQGSVRRAGDQVRIAVQLVRAKDSTQLWSENYDRKVDDIFKVQDEIAAAVVGELQVKLLGAPPTAKPVDPKVYPLILQGEALVNQGSDAGERQGTALFRQVLAVAPNEARAWAGMARGYFNQGLTGNQPAENIRLAKEAATKALELDPGNAVALGILGRIAADIEIDFPSAVRSYQRALALDPGNLLVINAAATGLMLIGRFDQSLQLYEYRVAHDPASAQAYFNMGNCLYAMRRWDAAIDAYRTAYRLSPVYSGVHVAVAFGMLQKGDPDAALEEIEAETDEPSRLLFMPMVLHALGREKESEAALQALIDKYGEPFPSAVGVVYGYLGNANKAFEWLEKATAVHDPSLSQLMMEPSLEGLHDDPRWLPFLRKIGFAPEQLAKIEFHVTLPQQTAAQ